MKRPLGIALIFLALAAGLLIWGFGDVPAAPTPAPLRYTLVIEDDTGSFLMQLQKGLREAAQLQGGEVTTVISSAYAPDGEDAVFLLVSDPAAWLAAYEGTAPVTVIGTQVEGVRCIVSDDAAGTAQLLALAAQHGGSVVVLRDDADPRGRLRGMAVQQAQGVVAVDYSADGFVLPQGCTAAVALSRSATRALVQYKRDGLFAGAVYGVDTGDDRVSDLEDGAAAALLLDNPYAMGYIAAAQQADGQSAAVAPLAATPLNMYLPQNVKQVFPLLQ